MIKAKWWIVRIWIKCEVSFPGLPGAKSACKAGVGGFTFDYAFPAAMSGAVTHHPAGTPPLIFAEAAIR
jgi:hypothetical protein